MKKFLGFILLVSLFACTKDNDYYTSDTKIIGHGGMGIYHDYPLNSFEAISLALEKGVDGVEIDVQMTKDRVLVAYHDEEFEEHMKVQGAIHDYVWRDIKDVQYEKVLYSEYKLVSVETILKHLPQFKDRRFFFDVKMFAPSGEESHIKQLIRNLVSLINKYELSDAMIEVRDANQGRWVKQLDSTIGVFVYRNYADAVRIVEEENFEGITLDIDLLNKEKVDSAHQKNIEIAVLNTHSTERNDLAHLIGVDYNQTDMVNFTLQKRK